MHFPLSTSFCFVSQRRANLNQCPYQPTPETNNICRPYPRSYISNATDALMCTYTERAPIDLRRPSLDSDMWCIRFDVMHPVICSLQYRFKHAIWFYRPVQRPIALPNIISFRVRPRGLLCASSFHRPFLGQFPINGRNPRNTC